MNKKATLPAVVIPDLKTNEAVIKRAASSFIEAGQALKIIRDHKQYKHEFSTFEAYCRERWGYGRTFAHYQITAAETAGRLFTTVNNVPLSESLIRPIVTLTLDKQREVWQRAVESAPDGKVTARHVAAIAREYREPKEVPARDFSSAIFKCHDTILAAYDSATPSDRKWLLADLRAFLNTIETRVCE